VHKISTPGDEIHAFVRDKCGGKWPMLGADVRITVNNLPFVIIYSFRGFVRVHGGETVCRFWSNTGSGEENVPDVPLSSISTWRNVQETAPEDVSKILGCEGKDHVLVKPVRGYFERFYFVRILDHPVGPQLVLRKQHPYFGGIDKIVPLGALEFVDGVQFTSPLREPILAFGSPLAPEQRLPVPCRVKMSMHNGIWKEKLHDRVVTFFGYSENRYKIGSLYAHFCTSDRHCIVEPTEVLHVVFQALGVES
jgi:hypothetical protein